MFVAQISNQMPLEDIIATYNQIYFNIGVVHGKRIGREINAQTKAFDPNAFSEFYRRYVAMYFQQAGFGRILTIRRTFIEFMAELMRDRWTTVEMFGDDPSPSRVATWVHEQAGRRSFYRWQALRIARTESTAASNLGGMRAAEEAGYEMQKEWLAATDPRTRRKPDDEFDHLRMNGKTVPMNETFKFPGGKHGPDELLYPGDPKGQPGNIINCRCTLIYKPMRDEAGNLIRKMN